MKKVLSLILGTFLLLTPIKASALNDNVVLNVNVSGDVKKGNEIEIKIDVKNVERFYAASMEYKYNPKQLEILSMKAGDITETTESGKYQPDGSGGEIIKERGLAKYSFTFMGSYEGNKGSGNFITIKAKVLNDEKLKISKNNMIIKLVERNLEDNMVTMKYRFNGFQTEPEDTNGYPDGGGTSGGNGGDASGSNDGNTPGSDQGSDSNGQASGDNNTSGDGNTSTNDGESGKGNDSNTSKNETEKGESKEAGSSSTIFLVIGGLVILGAVGGFVYMKRKNNSSSDDNSIGM